MLEEERGKQCSGTTSKDSEKVRKAESLQLPKRVKLLGGSGGFARHRLSPLAAFTSGAYFLHNDNGRR